jgi:DNA-binding LytR/AlgR family response regulator
MKQAIRIPGLWITGTAGAVKVDPDNIAYCYHNNDYTKIVYSNGSSTRAQIALKRIEDRLCRNRYYRCHRNYIVGLEQVRFFHDKGYAVTFFGKGKVLVSRRRKNKMLHMMEQIKKGLADRCDTGSHSQ